jgi:hypothetical protein
MNAHEMVAVARLADHYEKILAEGRDPLEVATHDFNKLKRDAPKLLSFLRESDRSDRSIGDWLYDFISRYKESGMSLKNFAADELERLEAVGPARKKSPAQLQREIDEVLAQPRTVTSSAFEEAKAEGALLEEEESEAGAALKVFPRGPTGLTPDSVRATPEWKAANARYQKAFARLRDFNGVFVKKFAKELRAERSARTRERESRSGNR